MIRSNSGVARFDLGAARWGAEHATTRSTDFLRDVSLLGGTMGSIVIALAVAVVVSRRLNPRSVVAFLAVVLIGQNILTNVIKLIVDRTRPDIDRLTGFSGASFPSGHSAAAAATMASVALLLGYSRGRAGRAVLFGITGGIAVAVAQSRILLGVHWLTDVIAGLVLGWTWFAVASIAFGGRLLRFAEPVEAAERVVQDAGDHTAPEAVASGDLRRET
jgi:undecaprenyl-diphosphatase